MNLTELRCALFSELIGFIRLHVWIGISCLDAWKRRVKVNYVRTAHNSQIHNVSENLAHNNYTIFSSFFFSFLSVAANQMHFSCFGRIE